jgi:HPt (histidine-containing phosphotransfer) domain-containing protein
VSETDQRLAAFDADCVSSLTGDADDLEFAHVFVTRFRRLLPRRLRRIEAALAGQDLEQAMDAVLSLKVSSCTVGAEELCTLGGRIEDHLRRADLAGAVQASEGLAGAADRTDEALAAYLRG